MKGAQRHMFMSTILRVGTSHLETHKQKKFQVRGSLSYRAWQVIAQLGMNLSENNYLIEDEP